MWKDKENYFKEESSAKEKREAHGWKEKDNVYTEDGEHDLKTKVPKFGTDVKNKAIAAKNGKNRKPDEAMGSVSQKLDQYGWKEKEDHFVKNDSKGINTIMPKFGTSSKSNTTNKSLRMDRTAKSEKSEDVSKPAVIRYTRKSMTTNAAVSVLVAKKLREHGWGAGSEKRFEKKTKSKEQDIKTDVPKFGTDAKSDPRAIRKEKEFRQDDKQETVSQKLAKYGWEDGSNITKREERASRTDEQSVPKFGTDKDETLKSTASNRRTIATKQAVGKMAKFKVVKEAIKKLQKKKKQEESEPTNGTNFLEKGLKTICSAFLGIVTFLITLFGPVVIPFILIYAIVTSLVGFIAIQQPEELPIVAAARIELEMADDNIGGAKYKEWYGINGNWCAMFVSYCANECGYLEDSTMPKSASVLAMSVWYQQNDQWEDAEDYIPKAGDIIFFQNGMSHVGIVVEYDAERNIITTIEGNTGSSQTEIYHEGSHVKECNYPLSYIKITGYGLPDYPEQEMNLDGFITQIYLKKEEYAA